ncbi:SWI/SNF chromatin-remodeling complex subunit [Entomophthora muscae]|nr:SWI/SNF chromatin-remodeling complex subunit [Entomophthora muscae]
MPPAGAYSMGPRPIPSFVRPVSSPRQPSSPLQSHARYQMAANSTGEHRPYPQHAFTPMASFTRPSPSPLPSLYNKEFSDPKAQLNPTRPGSNSTPLSKAQEVPLAPDAIRYDDSSHKSQRVALYRYKDVKYQEILTTSKQRSNLPRNPPLRRPLPPVTLVYDRDAGSAFFRQMPRLQEKLNRAGVMPETLVPIRLDIEAGGMTLSDAFTWNLHDDFINVEVFAEGLCRDLQLPVQLFRDSIVESIRHQLLDYAQHGQEGERFLEVMNQGSEVEVPAKLSQLTELRILIKLDITVGRVSLVDQFEWDILCPLNSPERFASILSADLGLGGEFTTAIAHSIREQIYAFVKSLVILGYKFDGGPITDPNLSSGFLAPVAQALRDRTSTEKFTPILVELSHVELVKQARSKERETRRTRRQHRARRRPALLPDRDPVATCRSQPKPQADFAPSPFPLGDPSALGGNPPTSPFHDT